MFRRILVPTDLTDRTVKALDVANRIAKGDDARVTMLHVIETISGAEFEEFASFYGRLEERARKVMGDIVARAQGVRAPVDVEIIYGRRSEDVLRFAQSNRIDFIVLSSHPLDPSQTYSGMGTMSYRLGILAPCAVLLVK